LSDQRGFIKKEGINLRDIPLDSNVNDEKFKIDTKNFVVVFPKKLYVTNPWAGMGYGIDLIPAKPSICAGSTTYKVMLNWVRRRGGIRPYRFEAPFPEFSITDDLGYEEIAPNLYKFKAVVTGRMVDPKN
jgi:hypothetical protein